MTEQVSCWSPEKLARVRAFGEWWKNGPLDDEERKMLGAKYFTTDDEAYSLTGDGENFQIHSSIQTGERKLADAGFLADVGELLELGMELFLANYPAK